MMEGEADRLPPEHRERLEQACDNFNSFIEAVSQMELGNNIAFYIGQGNVRGREIGRAHV